MMSLDPYERFFIHTTLYVHFISLFIALLFFMIVKEKSEKGSVKNSFMFAHFLIILWLIGKILKTVAPVLFLRWSFNVLYYIGILPIGPAFFLFSNALLGRDLKKNTKKIIFIPSMLLFFVVLTNPLHHLFYKTYTFFSDSFGLFFYVHVVITYIFMIISIFLLLRGAFTQKSTTRKAISLVIGALLPLLVNLNYVMHWIEPMFDFTPIVYNFSLIILGFAAFHFDFFNFVPKTVIKALDLLPGAIAINNNLYGIEPDTPFQRHKSANYTIQIQKQSLSVTRYINLESVIQKTEKLKTMAALKTEKHQQLNSEINKRVAVAIQKEKMNFAGEIHDILGYSISSIICLLENCRFLRLKNDAYRVTIQQAINLASQSQTELNNQLAKERPAHWKKKFFQLLSEIEMNAISCELIFNKNETYSDRSYRIFYKTLKESVTNCLKHSAADKLIVAIQKKMNEVSLYIIDNGKGCADIFEGTGLANMRRRINEIGGEINFYSEDGAGFQVSVSFSDVE